MGEEEDLRLPGLSGLLDSTVERNQAVVIERKAYIVNRNVALVLCGILLGCAAQSVAVGLEQGTAHAAAPIEQYCTTTLDYNNVKALDGLVRKAGMAGWALVGVYRPTPMGSTYEDYVCFRR